MKTFLISGVSALALAGMALAVPFEEADTDGDGRISFEELQAIDPATSEAEFTLYDVNLDGYLDEDEYAAWRVATQRDAEPAPVDEPLMSDEPLEDEFEVPEQDDADAYEPSLEKSLTKSDEHRYGDDKDEEEEEDEDAVTERLNEEQAEELEPAEEDGEEERPW